MATKKKKASRGHVAPKKKTASAAKKLAAAAKKKKPMATAKKRPAAAKKKRTAAAKKPATAKKKPAVAAKKAIASKGARPKARGAKKRAPSTSTPAPAAIPVRRRDGAGHLDPKYAATLREKSREGHVRDRDEAFIGRAGHSKDNLAEAMGETWVQTATSGEDESEEVFNQSVPEDEGGPFVTTTAGQEFADGTDASNPERSKREPFPKT